MGSPSANVMQSSLRTELASRCVLSGSVNLHVPSDPLGVAMIHAVRCNDGTSCTSTPTLCSAARLARKPGNSVLPEKRVSDEQHFWHSPEHVKLHLTATHLVKHRRRVAIFFRNLVSGAISHISGVCTTENIAPKHALLSPCAPTGRLLSFTINGGTLLSD